ncbi:hypothetical protein [Amycolatopsis anabasis]|uniref:hypothetical protein n=1 Tax=Amycolatopsis anabasis TaxID=1840409 RepID=UPI00131B110C|nr:hypothetical protein [Amycolatopsis anabasis]
MYSPEGGDRAHDRDFLEFAASVLDRLVTELNDTLAPDTTSLCRRHTEDALELLEHARGQLHEAALFADRCALAQASECDAPCRGPVDVVLVHDGPESVCGACVLHAGFGLHFLGDVQLVGDAVYVAEAEEVARQLAEHLPPEDPAP